MDSSTEDQIKSLLDEVETQKWILEDLMQSRPEDTHSAEETKLQIEQLESEVNRLLGAGPSVTSPNAPPQVSSPSFRLNGDPDALPVVPPSLQPTPHGGAQANSMITAPYWPSSAPSPFEFSLNRHFENSSEASRKRQRQDSNSSSTLLQSSKRSALAKSKARLDEIDEELERQLAEYRQVCDEMRDPENLQAIASTKGITIAQALEELDKEEKEEEEAIRISIQMDRDEELARMLEAEENASDSDDPFSPARVFDIPDRTLTGSSPYDTMPRRYPVPTQFDYPTMPGAYHGSMKLAHHGRESHLSLDSDDDIQEISRDHFQSRFPGHSHSGPDSFGRGFGRPFIPPSLTGRTLPWMQNLPETKAMDLIRENELGLDDDEDIVRYEDQHFPEDIKNLITGIKDIREATKAEKDDTPKGLKVTLMKHQKVGVAWMKAKEDSNHKGGILADDMGLGKTIQAIALMVARPPTDPDRHPSLVVAPKALMDQWRREIQRHVEPGKSQLSVFIFHERNRLVPWRELKTYDVIITTFGTLTANHKLLVNARKLAEEGKDASLVNRLKAQATLFTPQSKWHRVFVDEAQNIKNPSAKSTKACCELNATFRWCLTGTPMMNRLEDFQSLLGFLRIRPYNNKDKFRLDFPVRGGFVPEHIMQQLRVLVKSVCFRRTKTSKIDGQPILQLPPKFIEKVHVVFSDSEKELYDTLDSKTQAQITRLLNAGVLGKNYSHVLVLLLRLRQACCHPHLLTKSGASQQSKTTELDYIANAKLLSPRVVDRIKSNDSEYDGTCPICMDTLENTIIYIPCGHSVCSECYAQISDPAFLERQEKDPGVLKCQNCRGVVDQSKITNGESFRKVHDPDAESNTDSRQQDDDQSDDSETLSDSDTETDGSTGKRKTKSLAQLRQEAQKSKRAKQKYLRRLEKTWIPSAKIEKSLEILAANEQRGKGEKTIIFSQFTSLLDLLEVPIDRRGWKYVRFDGSMGVAERNASVAGFTDDPEIKVMLVSLKAGNSGLNLVAASHVILFDPFWNPYVEDQAIDRAHRIGQNKEVFVHRLLIEGTVEDRIVNLQDQKRELISGAFDEGGTMNVSRLNIQELAYLFGVRT
ncbi:hypothetical protein N7462_008089 [Penicillium macrosclerotiorum]|uniref:uncharacterized protein n=1 Tax=Penicillium macrosclerotiorum TaxID=303699 RepID=UPI0025476E1C|nr:uncharacterized protein N7462_008089 [Penicillium macrosclerotiorum]KAJ5679845.1 hypothetical protein N7462_008089 [Penicillium macrosclerotiorum]